MTAKGVVAGCVGHGLLSGPGGRRTRRPRDTPARSEQPDESVQPGQTGGSASAAEAAGLVVVEGLHQLFPGVHHEGAIARNRLADRPAGDQQEAGAFGAGQDL